MKNWNERTQEIANLLNPPFCASIIYSVSHEYQKIKGVPMPYVLVYLILPIVLHRNTREIINSKTNMTVWIQRNPNVLVGYPERAKSLVPFTNEAVEYLLIQKNITLDEFGLSIIKPLSKAAMGKTKDKEILECYNKSEHLGRWFVQTGNEENIYTVWGVKP